MAEKRAEQLEAAESERQLARYAAVLIPAATVALAIVVGVMFSVGPAILVLVGGALLGTISLLWASLRTLSGDAPLPEDFEAIIARTRGGADDLAERKRRVLRALKDLELERSVGKLEEKDFAALDARLREEAKQVMREMDERIDPMRDEAERVAKKYLEKRGLADGAASVKEKAAKKPAKQADEHEDEREDEDDARAEKATDARVACPKCSASNDPDAAFCKKCGAPLADAADAPPPEDTEEADASR